MRSHFVKPHTCPVSSASLRWRPSSLPTLTHHRCVLATRVQRFEEAGQHLTLRDLGGHVELLLGQVPILSSRSLETERSFGALARTLASEPPRRLVVGGLGFGATLLGTLSVLEEGDEILVVEKLKTVITLARGELAHLLGGALSDPRVRLINDDVAAVIARERALDAVLLDVDNGPDWASMRTNAALYAHAGLSEIYKALRPGGALAVWSGYPSHSIAGKMRRVGLCPSLVLLREKGLVRARAYIGRKPRQLSPRSP